MGWPCSTHAAVMRKESSFVHINVHLIANIRWESHVCAHSGCDLGYLKRGDIRTCTNSVAACVCVCVCVCEYVCVHIRICSRSWHQCVSVCVYAYIRVYTWRIHMRKHKVYKVDTSHVFWFLLWYPRNVRIFICTHAYMCIYTHVCAHIYTQQSELKTTYALCVR